MITDNEIWEKLRDPEYRKLFVEEFAKRSFATQLRTIRKTREWSQATLAQRAGVNQGVISRTEDPNLGTTFDTAAQVVSGFDLAFIPKIVSFSEFVRWVQDVSDGFTDLPTYQEEKDDMDAVEQLRKNQPLIGVKKPPSKASEAALGRLQETDDKAELLKRGASVRGDFAAVAAGRR
jgi:transcriptional regulator with XRE-family HTH domain